MGSWHINALNSEIAHDASSSQVQWLRDDLAGNQSACTLAYWHRPRFSSGQHGNSSGVQPFWQALYDDAAGVVLSGHDHTYERFAPQDPTGQADPTRGIREFVVGTGGASLYSFLTLQPNSAVRNNTTWGVLRMTLHPTSFDWEFVPVGGQTFTDSGSADCVGAGPIPTGTPTPTLSATLPETATSGATVTPSSSEMPTPTASGTVIPPDTATPIPTDTAIPSGTANPTDLPALTATLTPSPAPSHTPTPISTSVPVGDLIYVSSTSGGTAGGVSFANEDILAYDARAGAWSMYFDGSDVGLGGTDLDAFDLQPDGSLLLSLASDFAFTGFGTVDDSDILHFTPITLGTATAGSFAWYFDGSDVGLTGSGEDIDAIGLAPDGRLLISARGSFSGSGAAGADEDLFAFSGTTGAATSGSFTLYFDGSDVGLNDTSYEDVNGVWVDAATGKICLTT